MPTLPSCFILIPWFANVVLLYLLISKSPPLAVPTNFILKLLFRFALPSDSPMRKIAEALATVLSES